MLCEDDLPLNVLHNALCRALDDDVFLLLLPWVQVDKGHGRLFRPFPVVMKSATPIRAKDVPDALLNVAFRELDDLSPSLFIVLITLYTSGLRLTPEQMQKIPFQTTPSDNSRWCSQRWL